MKNLESTDTMESDIRATVDSVITQLASLESNTDEIRKPDNFVGSTLFSNIPTKKDILQQALKNSGLPSKNKTVCEGMRSTRHKQDHGKCTFNSCFLVYKTYLSKVRRK